MTEGPYKLPDGWRWVRLGQIATVRYGKAKPRGTGAVPVIGSGGVYATSAEPLIRFPTVIIGRKGSAGEPILAREPCWPSDTTFYLDWLIEVEPLWVFLWLSLVKISPAGTSATLPSVRREDVEAHPIPLPPLPEQRRIVARVEELMARVREARRLRQEAVQDAERLWQSVLAETFPRPGADLPEGWRWVRLGEIVEHQNGVWGPRSEHGFPVLRSTNFTDEGFLNLADVALINLTESQRAKALLQKGDILLERSGGGPDKPVGRVVYFDMDGEYYFGNFVTRLRVDETHIISRFLFRWLHWFHLSGQTHRLQTQTTNIRNLRFSEFLAQMVPLPPLPEQRRIVARVEAIRERLQALKKAQEETEARLRELERAILDNAFRGRLL